MSRFISLIVVSCCVCMAGDYGLKPAPLTSVKLLDGFWLSRFETNRNVTVWANFKKCEETGRIANFINAAKYAKGTFEGTPFNDSDVFKVIEGAAYTLSTHPDEKLEAYLDELIGHIAAAQEPDGYLYTARTLGYDNGMIDGEFNYGIMGPVRWSNISFSHELYNLGHLYEAAVAYYEATGKRTLLDVAIRSADLVDRTFGPGETQLKDVSGHEEIELALCKLFRVTGETRYLKLAKHLLDTRGHNDLGARPGFVKWEDGGVLKGDSPEMLLHRQKHKPVLQQTEAEGHAVCAGYLYSGMADIAALMEQDDYRKAVDILWENVVGHKLHLTGGVGARPHGESYGDNYELPNESAYLETCAAIANALWNQRMFLLHGDSMYVDVLERIIYNGFLSGISLSGDEFFYPNPMASKGGYARSKWFGCSCCPVNVVRFIPQIPQFAYATRENCAYVNLFVASEAKLPLDSGAVTLRQETAYPWEGRTHIRISPAVEGQRFALALRVPGWAIGRPVPSDLYVQTNPGSLNDVSILLNGNKLQLNLKKGYCVSEQEWKDGDVVEMVMNMPVRRIRAHEKVAADKGRLAVERGPIVYCAEGVDNGDNVYNLILPEDAVFKLADTTICGQTFPALDGQGVALFTDLKENAIREEQSVIRLIPYFAWCHRGAGQMHTWLPCDRRKAIAASSIMVTASHCNESDTTEAIFDGVSPMASNDLEIPRMTFWPHLGTEEWIEMTADSELSLKGIDVYWFDDEPTGRCRLPESWQVLWRTEENAPWQAMPCECPVAKDQFCRAEFPKPFNVKYLRLNIKLRPEFSGGILEARFIND